jgi:hypothetical protein
MAFAIKWKHKEDKKYVFMTSNGGGNSLKIHAARFETAEAAQKVINDNAADNTDFNFKVQVV